MTTIDTEIVIPVHDESRPVRRAAESVLKDPRARVHIVAHNISPDLLDLPTSDRLSILPLNEDPGMPGATFDAGIKAATAPWVGIMGSDDWYADGAIEAMRRRASRDDADGVIAPLTHQLSQVNNIKPLTGRTKRLDAVRDRMFFRTAPLGIFKRTLLDSEEYRFGNVFPAGSDMRVTALLWTSGASFSYYWDDPAYVVGKDAVRRVTFTPRPLERTGAPWLSLLDEPRVQAFTRKQKHALGYKMARVHVADAAHLRPTAEAWLEGDFDWLSSFTKTLREFDPTFDAPLSRRDGRLVRAVETGDFEETLLAASEWKQAALTDRAFASSLVTSLTDRDAPIGLAASGVSARLASRIRGLR